MAGLDPEDVQNLLRSAQGFSALRQKGIDTILGERNTQKAALEREKVRIANLRAAAKTAEEKERVRKLEAQAKIDAKALETEEKKAAAKILADSKLALADRRAALKAEAKKLSPEELRLQELDIQEQELDIAKKQKELESGAAGELTEFQRQSLANSQRRIDLAEAKEEGAKQRDLLGMEEDILTDQDNAAVQPLIEHINNTQNKPYYYIQYTTGDEGFSAAFTSNKLTADKVPLITKSGIQMDMNSVRDSAAAAGMSVEDFLSAPGIGILEKVGDNDYRPINR